MMGGFSRRGQPLIVLVLVLGGWVSARAMMWDPSAVPPVGVPERSDVATLAIPAKELRPSPEAVDSKHRADLAASLLSVPDNSPMDDISRSVLDRDDTVVLSNESDSDVAPPSGHLARSEAWTLAAPRIELTRAPRESVPPKPVVMPVPPSIAAGHQLLWMAALSQIPMPGVLLGMPEPAPRPVPFYPAGTEPLAMSKPGGRSGANRWSLDSWVLWRRGSTSAPSGGLLIPSYGASQAGAVLRFQLAPGSAMRPNAYLRTTAALNGSNEREVALGLALRPIARLPVSLQGEARYTSTPGAHALRPAVLAVTELPPFGLPMGMRGEIYGQAGYVGGKFATGFADGQLRLDHRLVQLGKADLRLGGGAWGGIQKGASRLDAGPSLTIGQPLGGPASIRLGADWRFRVAGKAAPGSGPAVTLSAGF